MPRRKDREQLNNTVSAAQYEQVTRAAALKGMGNAEFTRYALQITIESMGLDWPDDLPSKRRTRKDK